MSLRGRSSSGASGTSSAFASNVNKYQFIIPSADGKSILLQTSAEHAELPTLSSAESASHIRNWERQPCILINFINEDLGVECNIVRPAWKYRDLDFDFEEVVLVLELKDYNFTMPKNTRWVREKDIGEYQWRQLRCGVELKRIVTCFFNDPASPSSPGRRPSWRFPGWLRETERWVCDVFRDNNYSSAQYPSLQIAHTFKSLVFNCAAQTIDPALPLSDRPVESFFVKTSANVFREAKLTSIIASFSEQIVPEVVAFDEHRNVFVQRDVGSIDPRNFCASEFIDTVGNLQQLSMAHLGRLKEAGMEVLDPSWLLDNISGLLLHPTLDMFQGDEILGDIAWLRENISSIENLYRELQQLGIPNTVVHGDLHKMNVGGRKVKPHPKSRIFDWEWAFIGNPFHDFETVWRSTEDDFPEDTEDDDAHDLYFKFWRSRLSLDQFNRAVELSGALYFHTQLYRWLQLFESAEQIEIDRPLQEIADVVKEFRISLEDFWENREDA